MDWLDSNINYIILIYGLSFFSIPIGIFLKRREIAHFNLTDNFMGLAAFGALHGIADLMHLIPSYIDLSHLQIKYVAAIKILVDMISFQFLAHFAVAELTDQKTRYKTFFILSPAVISVYFIVGMTIVNSTKQAFYASLYLIALPSIALAVVSFLSLSKRFFAIDANSLGKNFFSLAVIFMLYALTKLWPVYSSFGVIHSKGALPMLFRTAIAFTAALLTARVLNAFKL